MAHIPLDGLASTNVDDILYEANGGNRYRVDGDPRSAFIQELTSLGFKMKGNLAIGQITRIADSMDKGTDKTGWYVFHLLDDQFRSGDRFGIGTFGSWHGHVPKTTWCSKYVEHMSAEERASYMQQVEEQRALVENEVRQRHADAAAKSVSVWGTIGYTENSDEAFKYPYIVRKQIKPFGARVLNDELIIPVYYDGAMVSYQRISDKGKWFLSGGRTAGGYFPIGDETTVICVAEGYATACSIHMATGYMTYAAFNAGNMMNVATFVASKHPKAKIILCGDDDRFTPVGNAGRKAADAAASLVGGIAVYPQFQDEDLSGKPTDFNDMACLYGHRAVRDAIMAASAEPAAEEENKAAPLTVDYPFPGIIADTVKWIVGTAEKPQPELALMNVITALGAIFGRRYRSPINTRTNIYMIAIAGSGSGKDHSRKSIRTLFRMAKLNNFMGPDEIISAPGLLSSLSDQPSQIMQIDEFGKHLQLAADKNAGGYLKQASTLIVKLYSSSNTYYSGGVYADKKKRETVGVDDPNLCIYGTSTLEAYANSLNSSQIEDGQLNRFLVIPISQEIPERRPNVVLSDPPSYLVDRWARLAPTSYEIGKYSHIQTVEYADDEVKANIFKLGEFEDKMLRQDTNGTGRIWNRYKENTIKLCMIFAIARDPGNPLITMEDLTQAEKMVRGCIDYMFSLTKNYMHDSEFEKSLKRVLRIIQRHKTIQRSTLLRSIPTLKSKDLDDIIKTLKDRDDIEEKTLDTANSPIKPVVYLYKSDS